VHGGCGPGEIWLIRETLPAVIRKPFPLETTVHTAPIGWVANSSRAIGMHANGPTRGSGLLPKRALYTAPGHGLHPGEEPCGWLHVVTLPWGVRFADTARDDVALWHETRAVVIAHITPLLPTATGVELLVVVPFPS
jgi:hypothetical protein